MMRISGSPRSLLLAVLLVALGCGGGESVGDGPPGWPRELVLGLVPSREANVLVENAAPMAEFLAAELGIPVRSFVPQDYTGLIEAMGSGRADIGLIPAFPAVLGRQRYGLEPILMSVRNGTGTYRSQWMTHDASVCTSPPRPDERGLLACEAPLSVMRRQRVAFTDPSSTSGYLFPAFQLLQAGIDPDRAIQPVFMGGHDAAVIAVYNRDVDFACSLTDARTMVLDQYPDVGRRVIVFNHSAEIPNDGVTVRGDLPEDLKTAIRDAFLRFAEVDAERPREERVLWSIYEIEDFTPIEPDLYDTVEEAFAKLRDRVDI